MEESNKLIELCIVIISVIITLGANIAFCLFLKRLAHQEPVAREQPRFRNKKYVNHIDLGTYEKLTRVRKR